MPLLSGLLAGVLVILVTVGTGCALVRAVDKVDKIPGLEDAEVVQSLKKHPGRSRPDGTLSQLQANPSTLAFGPVVVASESRQTVVISNPADFPVTVVRVVVQGSGFALVSRLAARSVIPAHGELAFTLTFHPVAQGASSGDLLLEIDSAVGRFTRVPLKGRGV